MVKFITKTVCIALISALCVGVNAQNAPQGKSTADRCENAGTAKMLTAKCSNNSSRAMWDVQFAFDATSAAQPAIATDGEHFYKAAWQSGYSDFSRYDMDGSNPQSFTIAGVTPDIRSLTYDGQYFYAGRYSMTLYKLDLANQTLIGTIPVTCAGIGNVRHITFDPTLDGGNGGFWVGDWTTIGAIKKDGTQLIPNIAGAGLVSCYGSAYDGRNNCLWLNTQRDIVPGSSNDAWIEKFDLATYTVTTEVYNLNNDVTVGGPAIGGGACVYEYDGKLLLAADAQVSPDRVTVYEIAVLGDDCPTVTDVTATLFEGNKVQVDWVAPAKALTNYKIYQNGTEKGTVPAGTTTWISDVLESGNYTFKVAAVYDDDCIPVQVAATPIEIKTCDKKVTNVEVDYDTDCGTATITWDEPTKGGYRDVVYSEGFEGTTMPALPTGWTSTGTNWETIDNLYRENVVGEQMLPHTGTRMLGNFWGNSTSQQWAFSPEIALTGGIEYTIHFFYCALGYFQWSEVDEFEVKIGNAPNAGAMSHLVLHNTTLFGWGNLGIWEEHTSTFTPSASGNYHIGFHDLRPAGQGLCIMIDDIEVLGETGPPPPTAYNVYRDGEIIAHEIEETTFEDTSFDPEQEHTWSVAVICSNGGDGEWVNVTKEACNNNPHPTCDPVTGATAVVGCETAVIVWTAVEGATGYEVSRDGDVLETVTEPTYTENAEFEDGETYTWTIKTVCGELMATEVTVSAVADCVGIHELSNSVSIYPNPANGTITITANNFVKVEIYNTVGQLVETKTVNSFDVSAYNTGIYFFKVYDSANNSVTKRVMVAR